MDKHIDILTELIIWTLTVRWNGTDWNDTLEINKQVILKINIYDILKK